MTQGLCLVVGMHRSGTSLISRCLGAFGAAHGDNLHVEFDNARGHWEDRDLIELNEQLLNRQGRSWASLTPRPQEQLLSPLQPDDQERARALVASKLARHRLYAFKDPRTTVLLPFWLPVLQSMSIPVSIVLCLRHPDAVSRSLAERDGFPRLRGLCLWLQYNLSAVEALAGSSFPVALIDYERVLANPEAELKRLGETLQLQLDDEELAVLLNDFIDPTLNHHDSATDSAPVEAGAQAIRDIALELHAALSAQARSGNGLDTRWREQVNSWRKRLAPCLALASVCDGDAQQLSRLKEAQRKAAALEAELTVVYQTLSWKLTRPLRWLRSLTLRRSNP